MLQLSLHLYHFMRARDASSTQIATQISLCEIIKQVNYILPFRVILRIKKYNIGEEQGIMIS